MAQTVFDGLTVLYRATESREGCAELCQDPTGLRHIRLRIQKPALQKSILVQLPQSVPARMTGHTLELLLPWQEGESLSEWLYTTKPTLGQRRDMCLSLLAGLIGSSMPADLITLSAREENLCFFTQQSTLLLFPDLATWRSPLRREPMVQAVAPLVRKILTRGLSKWDRFRLPEELQLILLRCGQEEYTCWEILQQDVSALPEALLPVGPCFQSIRAKVQKAADQYGSMAVRILVGGLVLAALMSLAGAFRSWYHTQKILWPGMTTVGNQVLNWGGGDLP